MATFTSGSRGGGGAIPLLYSTICGHSRFISEFFSPLSIRFQNEIFRPPPPVATNRSLTKVALPWFFHESYRRGLQHPRGPGTDLDDPPF